MTHTFRMILSGSKNIRKREGAHSVLQWYEGFFDPVKPVSPSLRHLCDEVCFQTTFEGPVNILRLIPFRKAPLKVPPAQSNYLYFSKPDGVVKILFGLNLSFLN